jgi:hypothetical protein
MEKLFIGEKVICIGSGVAGRIIKFYYPTSCEEQTLVETEDGRQYHAPTRCWMSYKDGLGAGLLTPDEFTTMIKNKKVREKKL